MEDSKGLEESPDGHQDSRPSTEEILESLLVDDAEIEWDPATGTPHVAPRTKRALDRSPDTA